MNFFKNIKFVTREILSNKYLISRLSAFAFLRQNRDAKLGLLWNIITPASSIFVYWLVFGVGLRTGNPRNGIPALPWIVSGMCPWLFVSQSITRGSNAIYRKSGIAGKIKFPLSVMPVSDIVTLFYTHVIVQGIVLILIVVNGVSIGLMGFQVIYYMLSALIFMISLAIFTSAISSVNRDFHRTLQSLMRMLFFLTPVLWSFETWKIANESFLSTAVFILKLNPIAYLIDGYRDSLLYNEGFWHHPWRTLCFWTVTLAIYCAGCNIHVVFRRRFNSMG